jgi:hypothetical protein
MKIDRCLFILVQPKVKIFPKKLYQLRKMRGVKAKKKRKRSSLANRNKEKVLGQNSYCS